MEVSGQLHVQVILPPGKEHQAPTREADWVPELVWTLQRREMSCQKTNLGRPAGNPSLYRLSSLGCNYEQ
jgi:hypothetical protein